MNIAIYGQGHLADALRGEVDAHPWLSEVSRPFASLAFAAHDVTDHEDAAQMEGVVTAFHDACLRHKTVVVLSQVPPGWTRSEVERLVKGLGVGGDVFYQVDTIIVRRAVARMLRPEQIIIGCADPAAPLPLAYHSYLALHDCPVLQMSYESAELAKCGINYMLTKQIEAACDLERAAEACGADYDDVARAMHNDARIGPHAYLRPGSPNQHLMRDVAAVEKCCRDREVITGVGWLGG